MTYELTINLTGAEKAESILNKLSDLSGALGSVGSIFGSSGGQSPISKLVSDVEKGKVGVHALGKEMKDATTAAAQGAKDVGTFLATAMGGHGKHGTNISEKVLSMMSEADRNAILSKIAPAVNVTTVARKTGRQKINNPEPFQCPELGGILRSEWLKKAIQGPDLTGSQRAKASMEEQERLRKEDMDGSRLNISVKRKAARNAIKAEKDIESFMANFSMVIGPMSNPGGSLTTAFSARQLFKSFTTQTGQGMIGKFGLSGTSGAALAAGVVTAAATAIGVAFIALKKTVEEVIKAFETARKLYSKALTGGMGMQWTVKRSLMANIMGVSEQDVFRFGAQMAYLNPKLEQASQILAKTARPLTTVYWNFKVLEANLAALFSKMANDAAPIINGVVIGLSNLVSVLNTLYNNKLLRMAISPVSALPLWAISPAAWLASKIGQKDINKMPEAQAWMKQLPASKWERMGLVTMGGGQDFARQIAQNTKQTVAHLATIARAMGGSPGSGSGGSWGMSKTVANP